jgi:hypothetical protein
MSSNELSLDLAAIIQTLEKTPDRIEKLLLRLSPSRWNVRPSGIQWSFVENVCHLRDIESLGYGERIRRILEEEKPFLPDIDGAALATERKYNDQDSMQALRDFGAARRDNLLRIEPLDEGLLSREGRFEDGVVTLRALIERMRKHDEEHLNDLAVLCECFQNENAGNAESRNMAL